MRRPTQAAAAALGWRCRPRHVAPVKRVSVLLAIQDMATQKRTFQTALPMMVPRSGGTLRAPSMVATKLSRRVLRDMVERRGSPGRGEGRGRDLNVVLLAINKGAAW